MKSIRAAGTPRPAPAPPPPSPWPYGWTLGDGYQGSVPAPEPGFEQARELRRMALTRGL